MDSIKNTFLPVWDCATRLFHWTLVASIIGLYLTGDIGGFDIHAPSLGLFITNMDIHLAFGTLVLVLLVFRLFWGISGSSSAQFKNFVQGPRAVSTYVRAILAGETPRFVGHNPAGALMVLALIGCLSLQAASGLFTNDDLFFEGPLFNYVSKDTSDTLTGLHHSLFDILSLLVVVHISAALFYRIRGEDLITPMITGNKPTADIPADQSAPLIAPQSRAILCLITAALIVWGGLFFA